ncbi:MAG TPA: hypothetical protein VJS30_18265 [Paraburkholderia sp.]|nr:hypothetical protein [Paraburkholderia sp.]
MNTFIAAPGFAIPLAMLCTAIVLLSPFPGAPRRRTAARRQSYLVAAILLGSPVLMIGLLYLVARLLFD